MMSFEWDETKNRVNLKKHGLDFQDAHLVFQGPVVTIEDTRFDEEARFITFGLLQGVVVVLVHCERESGTRIISMRKATLGEGRFYEKNALLRS